MIRKQYSKTGRSCRVTFELPAESGAETVQLCGDFNGWDPISLPMKNRRGGGFSLTISLKPGQAYQFRYVIDGVRWENDSQADAYVPNPYGSENSIIEV